VKNRLTDLNDYLFAQLERLADEDLSAEAIESEIKRASAVVQVADKIVINARLQLDAVKLVAEHGDRVVKHLPMIAASVAGRDS
jgi:hypothetical protein